MQLPDIIKNKKVLVKNEMKKKEISRVRDKRTGKQGKAGQSGQEGEVVKGCASYFGNI
jgi:hypothetical protein